MSQSKQFHAGTCRSVNLKKANGPFPAILLISIAVLFCSCGYTVKDFVRNPDFMRENQPERILNVLIVTEETHDPKEIMKWLETCSQTIDEQVGIRLKPTQFIQVQNLPSVDDINGRLTALGALGENRDGWDIMINLSSYGLSDIILGIMNLFVPVPMTQGYIDDTYRRIIVLKSRDNRTFVHEFFHAFIFSHVHSDGVMAGMTIQLIPFTPPLNNTMYLNETDRGEVLQNKWRNFRTRTQLGLKSPRDMIGSSN